MANDLTELLAQIATRGFTHDFSNDVKTLYAPAADKPPLLNEFHIVESTPFDGGTDPGDDVTLFLIESTRGEKGYLLISDSFHTDPVKARFISTLLAQNGVKL